ncbi:MAG TPA: phage terminase large subunit family protein [Verrucomicrobiae bacterium]|nr:phage terminase large subunit family protein [Verrucomicrobiae bacterium]
MNQEKLSDHVIPRLLAREMENPAFIALDKKPAHPTFADFLLNEARVPTGSGTYGNYTFTGREALREIVDTIDKIFTKKLADAEVSLAGGAQFGKTILELNLAAYITGQQFRNFGLYLPDDDLVEGIVDSKFRPDVVDQIGWFAEMVQVGKALNKSGRAVNRKGAFLVTDGERKAVGMIRGLGKVPTTFSMDVAAMDELDDIQPRMMKFVRGRLTASDLRFVFKTGTQRIHGRGMNKAWKDGSQGVFLLHCPKCQRAHNPEEEFPQIIRLVVPSFEVPPLGGSENLRDRKTPNSPDLPVAGTPSTSSASSDNSKHLLAPKLTWSGHFQSDGDDITTFAHHPTNPIFPSLRVLRHRPRPLQTRHPPPPSRTGAATQMVLPHLPTRHRRH